MTFQVVYAARALRSLDRIDSYLRSRSPIGARNVRMEIERTVELLADWPDIGIPLRPEGLRFHVTRRYRYRIIYRTTLSELQILDVLHRMQRGPSR